MGKKDVWDFERIIDDSLEDALRSGDFSKMKMMINDTVESVVEKTIASTASTRQAASRILGTDWKKKPPIGWGPCAWDPGKVIDPEQDKKQSSSRQASSTAHEDAEKQKASQDTQTRSPGKESANMPPRQTPHSAWNAPQSAPKQATSRTATETTAQRAAQLKQRQAAAASKKTEEPSKFPVPAYVKKVIWDRFLGGFMAVFGFLGAAPVWATTVALAFRELPKGIHIGSFAGIAALTASSIIFTVCAVSGLRRCGRARRFRCYWNLLKGTGYCSIADLSQGVGKSPRFVVRDLAQMIAAGMLAQAKLDEQRTCLIMGDTLYRQYQMMQEGVRAAQNPSDEKKQTDPVITAGLETVRQIRAANSALPGVVVTEKLTRLESVTTSIFLYVEQRPNRLPEIRRFMDYYLPTTLKLVKTYQEFECQAETPNTTTAKEEILATLDTISQAFEKLLDGLYEDDAMDVSTDISVLKTMLAQEGLTENEFTKGSRE